VAGALEVLRESGANEAGGAGDEDFHGVLLGGLIMAHVERMWRKRGKTQRKDFTTEAAESRRGLREEFGADTG